MILPRLSAGAISLMYVGPAGNAIPWPMPTIARPAIRPPMLRGLNVETKVAMITTTQPTMIATLRPHRSEIGAEKKKPVMSVTQAQFWSEAVGHIPATMPLRNKSDKMESIDSAVDLPDCVCSVDRSDNVGSRVMEVLLPVRGPLNRIKGR